MRTSKSDQPIYPRKEKWSKDEIEKLRWMLNQYKFTYPEICQELGDHMALLKEKFMILELSATCLSSEHQKVFH